MAYCKHTNSVHDHLQSHFSKRSIKFLLCFSLLCVLFSLLPLLLQSLKPFLMLFFSYIVEKSCMFLICNGLLIFIALNSGLINASSPPTTHQSIEGVVPIQKINRLESTEPDIAVTAPVVVEVTEYPQQEEKVLVIMEQENVLSDTYEYEDEEEGNAPVMIIDEDEDDEHGVDDTEELNKKCEDFIKMMKATFLSNNLEARVPNGSYIDNQMSLVAVN